MRYIFFTSLFLISSFYTLGQKKLLIKLDSNWQYSNHYIDDNTTQSFYSSGVGDEEISLQEPNEELLAAAIFFELNKWRYSKKRDEYHYNNKLDGIAQAYCNYYKKYRFKNSPENHFRLKRTLKKVPKYTRLDFTYIEGNVYTPYIVDYKRGSYYFDKEIGTSKNNLYKGRQNKNDSNYVPVPIENTTYNKVAAQTVKKWLTGKSGTVIRSKAYEIISIRVKTIPSSRIRKRIPTIKVMFLVGAYRNKFLFKMVDQEN